MGSKNQMAFDIFRRIRVTIRLMKRAEQKRKVHKTDMKWIERKVWTWNMALYFEIPGNAPGYMPTVC